MKKTEWFYTMDNKPVRVGYYECRECGGGRKHYWNGDMWTRESSGIGMIDNLFHWRGILKEQK